MALIYRDRRRVSNATGPAAPPSCRGPPREDRPAASGAGHAPAATRLRSEGTPPRASSSAHTAADAAVVLDLVEDQRRQTREQDSGKIRKTPARGSQGSPVTQTRHAEPATSSEPEPMFPVPGPATDLRQ